MKAFRDFELDVIRLMTAGVLSADQLRAVEDATEASEVEHTGVGYFVTVRHRLLPLPQQTVSQPTLIGEWSRIRCGFLLFLGGNELTLECHAWGGADSVPADIRDRAVRISAAS